MLMPSSCAARGEANATGWPARRISPELGGNAPARMFMNVDLPAPLAPTTDRTSPAAASKSTSSRTTRPGNCFDSARVSTSSLGRLAGKFTLQVHFASSLRHEFLRKRARPPIVGALRIIKLRGVIGRQVFRRHHARPRQLLALQDGQRLELRGAS